MNNNEHFKILHEAYKHHGWIEHCGELVSLVAYKVDFVGPQMTEHTFMMDNGAKIVVITNLENE